MNVSGAPTSINGGPAPTLPTTTTTVSGVAAVPALSSTSSTSFHETCRILHVGNLDPRVTEVMLQEFCSKSGPVILTKILPDKTYTYGMGNYGIVEFGTHQAAEHALQAMNGRKLFEMDMRISWASAPSTQIKEDTSHHFQIFIGDLSSEVTDQVLASAFSVFGSLSEARVMWDPNTGKSRGYGFVSFRQRGDADQALNSMNGQWLGSRTIRCNWANQKPNSAAQSSQVMAHHSPLGFEEVVVQAPHHNATVYVGNLPFFTTREHLISQFQPFGAILEVRMQAERGFGFVRMDTHENAAMAITKLQGTIINGRPVRCAWGKDRAVDGMSMYSPTAIQSPTTPVPAAVPHAPPGGFGYPVPGPYSHPVFQQLYSTPMTQDMSAAALAAAVAMSGPSATMAHMDPSAAIAPGGIANYDLYSSYYGAYGTPGAMPYMSPGMGAMQFAGSHDGKTSMNGQRIPH